MNFIENTWITGNKPFYLYLSHRSLYFDKRQRKTDSNITLSFRSDAELELYVELLRPGQGRKDRMSGEKSPVLPGKIQRIDLMMGSTKFLTVSYREFLENLEKTRKAGFKTFWEYSKNPRMTIIK